MGDANRVTKAIFAVAVAATVVLISVVILFLAVRVTEAENRAVKAEKTLSELTTQNRGPQGPEGDPGRAPTQEEIAAAVADYCNQEGSPCKGPQGEPGASGSNGRDGKDGVSVQGPAGLNGANGASITKITCGGTYIAFWSGSTLLSKISMVCIP